ncbi:ATP/GTP-binding protein [Marinobacterium sp. D7]|uniref:GTP-binding protein n=1 Tax=Marinobacterium ramblicola TaxID=2849041 RepID=UPI001C2CE2D1|nr:ATP/GTP-binding protein [Marinobacterium ramblicola]MBV1788725.1 ATP/GTP-binding protein [Marinobacterium ramblicola]
MADYKILFTGSVCSGKTTAIRSLSEIETVDTDAKVSDSVIRRKQRTTIAMDYGVLELTDNAKLHLYGTPGQERFRFMWQLMMSDLVADAEALVLMVDNTRTDPFKDIRFYVNEFRDYLVKRRLVIAVTHSDVRANPDYNYYMNQLKRMGLFTTVMFVDARDPADVLKLVKEVVGRREREVDWSALAAKLADNSTVPEAVAIPDQIVSSEAAKPISLIDAAVNTRGITGAMHLGGDRKVIDSNVASMQSQALLKAMVNLVSALEQKAAFLGKIDNFMLCGEEQETLSVFVEEEQALGLCSDKGLSLMVVQQQASDLLQWSRNENE